jgi:hypothetical protein
MVYFNISVCYQGTWILCSGFYLSHFIVTEKSVSAAVKVGHVTEHMRARETILLSEHFMMVGLFKIKAPLKCKDLKPDSIIFKTVTLP